MGKKAYLGEAAAAVAALFLTARRRRRQRVTSGMEAKVKLQPVACGFSVLVDPSALPAGWAVAPPLFYPPHLAVVPIVHDDGSAVVAGSPLVQESLHYRDPTQTSASGFLLCDASAVGSVGVAGTVVSVEQRLRDFCATNAVLSGLGLGDVSNFTVLTADFFAHKREREAARVTGKAEAEGSEDAVVLPFTHRAEVDRTLVYLGLNGLYRHAAIFLRGENGDAAHLAQSAHMIVNACSLAPLAATRARTHTLLAQKATGAGQGAFHVYHVHKSKLLHFSSPSSARVVHLRDSAASPECLFHFSVQQELSATPVRLAITTALLDRIADSAVKANEALPLHTFVSAADGATEQLETERAMCGVTVAVEEGARLSEREGLAVLYQQPALGAFFSVQPGGEVCDPVLCDSPNVLYYPFGSQPDGQPTLSLHSVSPLPSTWECAEKGDDVFVHNVLFHLTEWDKQRTACSFTEISGVRCAQFQEEKEDRRCRTYVLPRKDSLLLIRWETATASWDGLLPTLQFFIDTLHLDA